MSEDDPGLERKLLAAVIRQAPVGISISEAPSGRILMLSEKLKELLGRDEVGLAMDRYSGYPATRPDGSPYAVDDYPTVRTIRTGEVVEKEEMLFRTGQAGEIHRLEVSSSPVRNADGGIVAAVTIVDDVEESRRAEERLRASEERLRLVTRATNDAVMDWDLAAGRVLWNEAIRTVFGYGDDALDVPSGWWTERIHPEDADAILADLDAAVDAGAVSWAGEYRFRRADGSYAHVVDRCLIVRDDKEPVRIVGSLLDISARKQAEERQAMLLAELQHRVRNILATIRSIARRTAAASETVDDYAAHLEGIIDAMARTQVLLTREPGAGVGLVDILAEELAAHAGQQDRIACSGPVITLSSKAAEVLTLAIHELATNSVKHGALRDTSGRIEIGWAAASEAEGVQWLRFTWRESGITPPVEPRRQGFGTELITRRIPFELGGRSAIEFAGDRLTATIEFPLLPGDSILQTDAARLDEKPS